MLLEKFFDRGQIYPLVQLHLFKHPREGHLAELVMMAVALAVGRGHKDTVFSLRRGAHSGILKQVAVIEEPAEGDALRQSCMVEDYRYRTSRGKLAAVGTRYVQVRPSGGEDGA